MPLPASLHALDFGEQFQYARHVFARQKQQEQVERDEPGQEKHEQLLFTAISISVSISIRRARS
ncbi:GM25764 [Drosophila sechellia]|uniref:GM25764 n=1 Tax=Drosophila sechellia TaxID=7238 RepID=B4HLZ2_DROSE|nr:GM25764 [Drosophila sechellia]